MKLHTLFVIGIVLGLTACGEKVQSVPKSAAPKSTDTFVKHMHYHARQLERINIALAADNLDAAQTPAYWLAAHDQMKGAAEEWQPFIDQMRDGARAVGEAPDLETARAATQRIAASCADCHAFAGVEIPTLVLIDK